MSDQDDPLPSTEFFKSFHLGDAWDDVKDEFRFGTTKTKAASAAKFLGKSLWNAGLNIAKNAPAYLEKEKERIAKEAAVSERKKAEFSHRSNADLIAVVKRSTEDSERRIAYDILKQRKEKHDAQL